MDIKDLALPGLTVVFAAGISFASLESNNSNYDWLTWNQDKLEGIFVNQPERSQIPENIKEQLIVELYSK